MSTQLIVGLATAYTAVASAAWGYWCGVEQERGIQSVWPPRWTYAVLWPLVPIWRLGWRAGKRAEAKRLAPQRVKEKLLQEQMAVVNKPTYVYTQPQTWAIQSASTTTITSAPVTWPTAPTDP